MKLHTIFTASVAALSLNLSGYSATAQEYDSGDFRGFSGFSDYNQGAGSEYGYEQRQPKRIEQTHVTDQDTAKVPGTNLTVRRDPSIPQSSTTKLIAKAKAVEETETGHAAQSTSPVRAAVAVPSATKVDFPAAPIRPKIGDVPVLTNSKPVIVTAPVVSKDPPLGDIDGSMKIILEREDDNGDAQPVYSLDAVSNPKSEFYKSRGMFMDEGDLRNNALKDAAKGVGVRAGFAYEAVLINRMLEGKYRRILDARFPFFYLMLANGKIVPPVITEVKNQQERSGDNFLYLNIGSYEIVTPARLSLKEPGWRDYLSLPVNDPRPPEGVEATGAAEQTVWKRNVEIGWAEGRREARRTLTAGLNRLIRDYTGMQRYHSLAKKGAITIPSVTATRAKKRVEGNRLFVGEERLEIRVSAKFKR